MTAAIDPDEETMAPAQAEVSPAKRGIRKMILGAVLGGGAYGSARLADWAVPRETRQTLGELNTMVNRLDRQKALSPGLSNPSQIVSDYAHMGNKLLKQQVFGVPARDFVQFVREKVPTGNPWKRFFSDAHYDAFNRGPAYGAAQLIDERAADLANETLDDKEVDYLRNGFSKEFASRLEAISKSRTGRPFVGEGGSLREGLGYLGDTLDPGDQEKVLKGLGDSWLLNGQEKSVFGKVKPDQFRDTYRKLVEQAAGGVRDVSLKNYQNLGRAVMNVHQGLGSYLPAALGIGAVGLTGAGLLQMVRGRKKTKPDKEKAASIGGFFLISPNP